MSIKKLLVVAGMALVAVAMIPTMASATGAKDWTKNGVKITQDVTLDGTGSASFFSETFGGISCEEAHASIILHASPTGMASPDLAAPGNGFVGTTEDCVGFGVFEGCEIEFTEITPSATIETLANRTATLTSIEIYTEFMPGSCFTNEIELTFPDMSGVLDNPNAASTIAIEGSGTVDFPELGIEAEALGEADLTITPAQAGIYGIAS